MKISLSLPCLRVALLVASFLPAVAVATDYPAGTTPDPLWLRTCPVNFFGSNSYNCELLGLVGPVARVSYPAATDPDMVFQLDNNGRIAEVHRRVRDMIGGWGRRKFSYGSDGLLNSITFNGQPNSDFQYSDGRLSNVVSHVNKNSCSYSFSGIGAERLSLHANCRDNFRTFQYRAELDSRGRVLKLDQIGAQQMNTQGPLECTWATERKFSSSQCSDGYYTHRFEYDERGRPVTYNRKTNPGNGTLVLSFSYIDDRAGNWTTQTIHYVEMSMTKQLPSDVVRSRAIEYFR
jgi:hypothetical protein